VYKDEKLMRFLYNGWDSWLEKKGKELTVEEDSDIKKIAFSYDNVDSGS
jgi:hypothetical protein